MAICKVCGAELTPARGTKGMCCGSKCSVEYTKIYYSKPKRTAICQECGKEFTVGRECKGVYCSRKCQTIAYGRVRTAEAQDRAAKAKEEAQIKANQKAFIKAANRLVARKKAEKEKERQDFIKAAKRLKLCMECGSLFVSHNNSIYCSDNCRGRRENRLSDEYKRYAKLEDVDYSITLLKLMKRDGETCRGCHKKLNINTDPCSKDYPTIDHIIPISKGGAHKWSNVQLLCRSCNCRKYNK